MEYACIAVLELAMRFSEDEPVQIRKIAAKHGIPSRFLVQILLQLKNAGIVQSTRGASGGYKLSTAPEKLSLSAVMSVIDGGTSALETHASSTPVSNTLIETWNAIIQQQEAQLKSITFADLARQARQSEDNMYYI
jgi:Rrf2 family protein